MSISFSNVSNNAFSFPEAPTAQEVLNLLHRLPLGETIVFCDVDDTLITPQSKSFRMHYSRTLIDEIKQNKKDHHNFEEILSHWRLHRKAKLVDPKWPEVLKTIKNLFPTYGLTKMNTGRFGFIESLEEWRYNELKNFLLEFSPDIQDISTAPLQKSFNNPPVFYKGIFMTGDASKGETLNLHKHALKGRHFVLIDDREDQLNDVKEFCQQESINFLGILFKGVETLAEKPDPRIMNIQKHYLIGPVPRWLEDEEAEALLKDKLY